MLTIENRTEDMVPNAVNVFLGVALILSPWFLGVDYESAAARNTLVSGIAITTTASLALNKTYDWEEITTFGLGLWVAMAPWVLGFAEYGFMMWIHLAIGLSVAAVSASELWRLFVSPGTRSV